MHPLFQPRRINLVLPDPLQQSTATLPGHPKQAPTDNTQQQCHQSRPDGLLPNLRGICKQHHLPVQHRKLLLNHLEVGFVERRAQTHQLKVQIIPSLVDHTILRPRNSPTPCRALREQSFPAPTGLVGCYYNAVLVHRNKAILGERPILLNFLKAHTYSNKAVILLTLPNRRDKHVTGRPTIAREHQLTPKPSLPRRFQSVSVRGHAPLSHTGIVDQVGRNNLAIRFLKPDFLRTGHARNHLGNVLPALMLIFSKDLNDIGTPRQQRRQQTILVEILLKPRRLHRQSRLTARLQVRHIKLSTELHHDPGHNKRKHSKRHQCNTGDPLPSLRSACPVHVACPI